MTDETPTFKEAVEEDRRTLLDELRLDVPPRKRFWLWEILFPSNTKPAAKDCKTGGPHQWGKWIEIENGTIYKRLADGGRGEIGRYIDQKRECKVCGVLDYIRHQVSL